MSDKVYHTRKNMTWKDVKSAMSRVKKFRKSGFYLEVEEQESMLYNLVAAIPQHRPPRKINPAQPFYTTRLWGPTKDKISNQKSP